LLSSYPYHRRRRESSLEPFSLSPSWPSLIDVQLLMGIEWRGTQGLREKSLLVHSVDYQLGTPRGRYDEHNSKFSLSKKPRFNRPVGERNYFWRLMLIGFWQGALPALEATWNLHTTQPRYFAPTCSEVVNLTGLLKTKDLNI
jgi:hypothetical protein